MGAITLDLDVSSLEAITVSQLLEVLKSFDSVAPDEAKAHAVNIEKHFKELLRVKAHCLDKDRMMQISTMVGKHKLPPATLHNLGVIISKSELKDELKSIRKKFYKLVVKRSNSSECRNYAESILEEDPEYASFYAKKAVDLTKDKHFMHEHSDVLYKTLKEKEKSAVDGAKKAELEIESRDALINYLIYCSRAGRVNESSNFLREEFKRMIIAVRSTEDKWKEWMESLKSIKESSAKLILMEIHRETGEKQVAWQLYCSFNQRSQLYENAIKEAKELIIESAESILQNSPSPTIDQNNEEQSTHYTSTEDVRKCKNYWEKESKWFHSIASEELEQVINRQGLDMYLPEKRECLRRHLAESKFFDPKRSKKKLEIKRLIEEILAHRYRPKNKKYPLPPPIVLQGISARLVITAERLFQETIIELSGGRNPILGIPYCNTLSYSNSTCLGPIERYKCGFTIVKAVHRTEPHPTPSDLIPPSGRRLGASYCLNVKSYDKIHDELFQKYTDGKKEKERKLAAFIIDFAKSHQPVTCDAWKEIYKEIQDVDLHKCCFLIVDKEQAQFHSATCLKKYEEMHFGMTVAHARCLIMIREGWLHFDETFMHNVPFGVYSRRNILANIDEVKKTCQNIEKLYKTYLESKHVEDHIKFSKKKCIKNGHDRNTVLTREQAHKDLKDVYGGESDTSGEEYLSEVDEVEDG